MKTEDAYQILNLQPDISTSDLTSAYRKLVLKYHPDRHSDADWAHQRMIEINQAYALLKTSSNDSPNTASADDIAETDDLTNLSDNATFLLFFNNATELIIDGFFIYYQYGLQNIHQRESGSFRGKYRKACRFVKEGFEILKQSKQYATNKQDNEYFEIFSNLTFSFLKSMLISQTFNPVVNKDDKNAYTLYRHASEALDHAMVETFCQELRKVHISYTSEKMIETILRELLSMLHNYQQSIWFDAGQTKLRLAESLAAFLKLRG